MWFSCFAPPGHCLGPPYAASIAACWALLRLRLTTTTMVTATSTTATLPVARMAIRVLRFCITQLPATVPRLSGGAVLLLVT
jgi:hypothetical protein